MACLRGQAPDGRLGIVSCDEEGCLFRRLEAGRSTLPTEEAPETHCLLQLQLRAGDAEDTEYSPDPDHEDAGRDRPARVIENAEFDFNEFALKIEKPPSGIERAGDALDEHWRLSSDDIKRGIPITTEQEIARFDPNGPRPTMGHEDRLWEWDGRPLEVPPESGGDEGEHDPEILVTEEQFARLVRIVAPMDAGLRAKLWVWFDHQPGVRRELESEGQPRTIYKNVKLDREAVTDIGPDAADVVEVMRAATDERWSLSTDDIRRAATDGESNPPTLKRPSVSRGSKYEIHIDNVTVVGDQRTEQRIRVLTDEQLRNFKQIFGG